MIETTAAPQRAAVICPYLKRETDARDPALRLAEAVGLAEAIHLQVAFQRTAPLEKVRPSHYLGQGVLEELKTAVTAHQIIVTIVDAALSPVQQRNLERFLGCKVIDRTALILEIFGERAQTREGQLQVELAALTWQRSRLVRSWTHLERQRGGFGFLGGPGESQIELDRRLITDRIVRIRRELEQVTRTRGLHRTARARVPFPVVALVGYTNAGKSTLFNALTRAGVLAEDMLFATLDPTLRAVDLPGGQRVMLSDTVGFISHLPTTLVAAFRATLEEVQRADLILHVRDITHPETGQQRQDVLKVLGEIGLAQETLSGRMVEVWNKTDQLDANALEPLAQQAIREKAVMISAITGNGLDGLVERMHLQLTSAWVETRITVPYDDGQALAWLYANGRVQMRDDAPDGVNLVLALPQAELMRYRQRFGG